MLNLTRRSEEGITLRTSDGEVHILFRLEGNNIRLAIEAPESVVILRDELLKKGERARARQKRPTIRTGWS